MSAIDNRNLVSPSIDGEDATFSWLEECGQELGRESHFVDRDAIPVDVVAHFSHSSTSSRIFCTSAKCWSTSNESSAFSQRARSASASALVARCGPRR